MKTTITPEIEANMDIVLQAFLLGMDKNGCIEKENLVALSGLDSVKVRQAICF